MSLRRLLLLSSLCVQAATLSAQASPTAPTPTAADSVRSLVNAAKSDLRNFVVAQEAYYADNARYSNTVADLKYRTSNGSRVELLVKERNSWSARLTNPRLRGSCVIFVNLPAESRPATALDARTPGEGEPLCDAQPELPEPKR